MLYLLDTNTCIAIMRGHPKAIQRIKGVAPGDCAISTITSYELFTGVEKCLQAAKERAKVELLMKTVHEVPFGSGAALAAARTCALLERQGQPIGPYDTLLAGHALDLSLILVSANTGEFSRVPGLTVEDWQT